MKSAKTHKHKAAKDKAAKDKASAEGVVSKHKAAKEKASVVKAHKVKATKDILTKQTKTKVTKTKDATTQTKPVSVKPVKTGSTEKALQKNQLDKRITNREFKLLINPQGLDRRSRIAQLSSLLVAFCQKSGVEFFHLDNANTGLRNVYFYDTPGEHFRRNNLILRVRESRQNVWVDDWCEVTLKCRAHTLLDSLAYDPKPKVLHKSRLRLKEEILRGDGLGTTRMIYSNNAILDTVPVDSVFERTMKSVIGFFPDLQKLGIEENLPVRIVGGRTNKILEACLPLGNLVFGENVQAHCDIGIWMRSVGDPIIGELAFSYRVNDENRAEVAAHKKADKFFKQLQLALPDWLASGSTKTALIYGKPE